MLALFKQTPDTAVMTVGGGIAYGILMLTVGRRLFGGFARAFDKKGELSTTRR